MGGCKLVQRATTWKVILGICWTFLEQLGETLTEASLKGGIQGVFPFRT